MGLASTLLSDGVPNAQSPTSTDTALLSVVCAGCARYAMTMRSRVEGRASGAARRGAEQCGTQACTLGVVCVPKPHRVIERCNSQKRFDKEWIRVSRAQGVGRIIFVRSPIRTSLNFCSVSISNSHGSQGRKARAQAPEVHRHDRRCDQDAEGAHRQLRSGHREGPPRPRTRPPRPPSPLRLLDRRLSPLHAPQVVKSKYDVPETFPKTLAQQLKALAAKGKLVRVKASFKLSEELKKPAALKPAAAKKAKVTTKLRSLTSITFARHGDTSLCE